MFAWKKSNNKRGLRKDMDKLNLKFIPDAKTDKFKNADVNK